MVTAAVSLFIGGSECAGKGTFDRLNPLTGKLVTQAAAASVDDARAACEAAKKALPEWSSLGPNARRSILLKAADALVAKSEQFVEAMQSEIGATKGWALFNLMLASSMVREAAALTTQISGEVIRVRSLRWQGGHRCFHRAAVDHYRDTAGCVPAVMVIRTRLPP